MMNERIRELYARAGLTMNNPLAYEQWYLNSLEKFAELIVKECADVIFNGHFSDDECEGNSHRVSYNNGRFGAAKDIKKHFGVEE
jgi:hypothetical protein